MARPFFQPKSSPNSRPLKPRRSQSHIPNCASCCSKSSAADTQWKIPDMCVRGCRKIPEENPEETAEDLKALRGEKGQDLAKKDVKALEKKKREEKESLQKKPVGFTPGAVAKFIKALIMQKLEEVRSIDMKEPWYFWIVTTQHAKLWRRPSPRRRRR